MSLTIRLIKLKKRFLRELLLKRSKPISPRKSLMTGIPATLGYWSDQRVRFLIIGAWNTAFGYVTFVIFYALLANRVNYLVIAFLAHACAVTAAFAAHKRLVFRSSQHWLPEFLRYNISLLIGLATGLFLLWLSVSFLGLHPIAAQAIVTVLIVALNYFFHTQFSFSKRKVTP